MLKIFNVKVAWVASAILFVAFAFYQPAKAQQPSAFAQFGFTNNHTVATNFAPTNILALKATLIGLQAGGVSNTAAVYVGPSTNATYYIIYPGERHVIEVQPGTRISLNTWALRTPSTGDGLFIIYQ